MTVEVPARVRASPRATPGCVLAWLAYAACVAVQVHIAVRRPGGPDGMSDLGVYVGAARLLSADGSLYAFVAPNGDQFVYPPLAGLLLVPLGVLPDVAGRAVWTLLQAGEVALLAWVVVRRGPVPARPGWPRSTVVPVVAVGLMLGYPVFSGLFLGQLSLLVTLLALLDAVDLTPQWCRGVPTGLAAALKLTPLVFVPYLWLTGRRRAAGLATATFLLAGLVALVVAPDDSRRYWASGLVPRPFVDLGQGDNASLLGLLVRAGWPVGSRWVVLVPAVVLVLALGQRRARDAHRRGQLLAGAVVVGAVGVLVSPVSWSHHQVPLVLAAACSLSGGRVWTRVWSAAVLALTSIPVQAVLLHLWTPGPLLAESSVLLALAVACAVPFGVPRVAPGPRARPALRAPVDPEPADSSWW